MPPFLRRHAHLLIVLFAICAALLFLYARWHRRDAPFDDFGTVFGAARCWMHRENPYTIDGVVHAFRSGGGPPSVPSGTVNRSSVYFLSAMPFFASMAWLSWPAAHALWFVLCTLSLIAAVWVVSSRVPLPTDGKLLVGAVALLLCKPFSTGLWFGNPAMIIVGILALSAELALRKRAVSSGVLLGVALAIKPQLAIGLFLALVLARAWTVLGTGIALAAVSGVIGVWRAGSWATLKLWLATQHENITASLWPGHINDPRIDSVYGFSFLNLQTLAGVFTGNPMPGDVIALLVCIALIAVYWRHRKQTGTAEFWTDFCFFTIVFLVPAYHRNYDGQVVMFLIPWIVAKLKSRFSWSAALVAGGVFLILAGSFLWPFRLLGPHAGTTIVGALIFRHQAFVIAGLASMMAVYAYRRASMPVSLSAETATAA